MVQILYCYILFHCFVLFETNLLNCERDVAGWTQIVDTSGLWICILAIRVPHIILPDCIKKLCRVFLDNSHL